MRRRLVALGCAAAALAAPATAGAADHLVLQADAAPLDTSALEPAARARLAGWGLRVFASADSVAEWFPGSPVPVATAADVSVELVRDRGGVREVHGTSDVVDVDAIEFDGSSGTLVAHVGAFDVDVGIQRVGAPTSTNETCPPFGVRARAPVRLSGAVELRTGTGFFGTVRATQVEGTIVYNVGGPGGACYSTAPPFPCVAERVVDSYPLGPPSVQAAWARGEGTVTVQSAGRLAGVLWGHVLSVTTRRSPFAGRATRLRIRVPPPLRGRLVYESRAPPVPAGSCGTVTRGVLGGRVEAAYRGFGVVRRSFRGAQVALFSVG
jgi:hypothetical protein